MGITKRHWFWNVLLIVAVLCCLFAFVLHYRNWTKMRDTDFEVWSGIYHQKIPFTELQSAQLVARIPHMERMSGFSAMTSEKGVFKDSITGHRVYVFVDDLKLPKIHLQYQDSLQLFLNYSDSLKTVSQLELFKAHLVPAEK